MLYRDLPRKGVLNIEFAPSGDMVSRKANRKLQRLSPLGGKVCQVFEELLKLWSLPTNFSVSITKTSQFKYTENFTTEKMKIFR